MQDIARKETDEILSKLEKDIKNEYALMEKEILNKYENEIILLKEEGITKKNKKRLKKIIQGISLIIIKYNKKIIQMINEKSNEVYKINFDDELKNFEKLLEKKLNFKLQEITEEYITEVYYSEETNKTVMKSKIEKQIVQLVIAGVGIKIIRDTIKKISKKQLNGMILTATKEVTRKENLAKYVIGFKYKDEDRSIKKRWITMGDSKVREQHQILNGEIVDVDKVFSNGQLYPGDTNAPPSQYMNCRCKIKFVKV